MKPRGNPLKWAGKCGFMYRKVNVYKTGDGGFSQSIVSRGDDLRETMASFSMTLLITIWFSIAVCMFARG